MFSHPSVQQISVLLSNERKTIVSAKDVSPEQFLDQLEKLRGHITTNSGSGPTVKLQDRMPPFSLCITNEFADHVRAVHDALGKALIDIVGRWYSDAEAQFPQQMPLEPHEEDLLAWMYGDGEQFVGKYGQPGSDIGIWRSDFLMTEAENGSARIRIIEINARLPFNGSYMAGFRDEATMNTINGPNYFSPVQEFDWTKTVIRQFFDETKPLYVIREKWPGIDSPHIQVDFEKFTGQPTKVIKPSQLRVIQDKASSTRSKLYFHDDDAADGSTENGPIEIDQCCIELLQSELATLDKQVLRQLAVLCRCNDLRTIFLVHDKRLLGIIRDQLSTLVQRCAITKDEAELLQETILETIIPGTASLRDLLSSSRNDATIKDNFIIKTIRDGSGEGVNLGKHLSQEEWLSTLEKHSSRATRPSEGALVIQKLNKHIWHDIVFMEEDPATGRNAVKSANLVGAQHVIHGGMQNFGPWRTAIDKNIPMVDIDIGAPPDADGPKVSGMVMSCVLRSEVW